LYTRILLLHRYFEHALNGRLKYFSKMTSTIKINLDFTFTSHQVSKLHLFWSCCL